MNSYLYSIRFLSNLLNLLDNMRQNRDIDHYNRLLCSLGDLVDSSRQEYFRFLGDEQPRRLNKPSYDLSDGVSDDDELPF